MTRLSPVRPRGLDLLRRLSFAASRRMYGRELEPLKVIAHHRRLLFGYGMLGMAANGADSVPQRLKSLAMLRAAQLAGCEWCLDFGSWHAVSGGVPEEQLRTLSVWRQADHFDEDERLVLEYAEAITRTPVEVSDELFASLRQRFDERQIVELTLSIALENLYSRVNWAFGIEGEGFSEGTYCVRPERLPEGASAY